MFVAPLLSARVAEAGRDRLSAAASARSPISSRAGSGFSDSERDSRIGDEVRVLRRAAEQDRPDILKRREAWFEDQLDLDPARLVFIDETGAATNMARLRGRAPKGERLRAGIPRGH